MVFEILITLVIFICLVLRVLKVTSQPEKPELWCLDYSFLKCIYKIVPLLQDPYIPTRLWGFSGHLQTVIHSITGRLKCQYSSGERIYLSLNDGSTLTYNLYNPLNVHETDIIVAICPGIANSSETVYIRTFVHYAQCQGYRCAVLNHIGAVPNVEITSTRIFSYGHTDDFAAMVNSLLNRYPATNIVCVGFSLGGNLVTKYMGEHHLNLPSNILGAISICQGYNIVKATKRLLNWGNLRRLYLYIMTEYVKSIIVQYRHILLSEVFKQTYNLNENDIISAATLPELDEAYTRRVYNFNTVSDFYKWSSSINYLDGIKKPMVFINARDDPLIPEVLLDPVKEFALSHNRILYIELANGGHLGFYEGGLICPNRVTWLDRAVVGLVGGIVVATNSRAGPYITLMKKDGKIQIN